MFPRFERRRNDKVEIPISRPSHLRKSVVMRRTRTRRVCSFIIISGLCWLYFYSNVRKTEEENEANVPIWGNRLGKYEPKTSPIQRYGPGEDGKPHKTKRHPDAVEYGINLQCSEEISLERSIPDTRLPECKYWNYPQNLPRASVIIVFRDVGWSVLLRTTHSVMNRSPPELLEEVVLVDDCSKVDRYTGHFQRYIKQFGGKVKYFRNSKKIGLLRARYLAAKTARGSIIVFLDAYCEVNVNWLPPLLSPIHSNTTSISVPIIDIINPMTFEYKSAHEASEHYRGIFDWSMAYREHHLPPKEVKSRIHESEPYKSPTHFGGLLAVSRDFFLSVGGYDILLWGWNIEDIGLSFKCWLCGQGILWVPCSRVGLINQEFLWRIYPLPSHRGSFLPIKGPPPLINLKRVVETWLDPKYKKYFYTRVPQAGSLKLGDIARQSEDKRTLNCKSFEWFMKNVAYEMLDKYPEPPENAFWGRIINVKTSECMNRDSFGGFGLIQVQSCYQLDKPPIFRLNTEGQLGIDDLCVDIVEEDIQTVFCTPGTMGGPWHYNEKRYSLLHRTEKKCATLDPTTQLIEPSTCNSTNLYQKWKFQILNPY